MVARQRNTSMLHVARGTIRSQLSNAYVLSSTGGPPTQFPIDLSIDLNKAKAVLKWTPPAGTPQSATLGLDFTKTVARPEGANLLFSSDEASDDAVYAVSLILI